MTPTTLGRQELPCPEQPVLDGRPVGEHQVFHVSAVPIAHHSASDVTIAAPVVAQPANTGKVLGVRVADRCGVTVVYGVLPKWLRRV